jgi:hypothetical protein
MGKKKLEDGTINCQLIASIKGKITNGESLAKSLETVLGIGKESVYRRLRGEVPFTIEEALRMAEHYGISLDDLSPVTVNPQNPRHTLTHLHMVDSFKPIETYYQLLRFTLGFFIEASKDKNLEWYTAANIIPQAFFMDHDNLARFLLYKWMYQNNCIESGGRRIKYFSEVKLPQEVTDIHHEYVRVTKGIPYTCFIFDRMMCLSLINDIHYFNDINLLTSQEAKTLKEEYLSMIDSLEDICVHGCHANGKQVNVYVSNINFDASYSYLESSEHKVSFLRVYAINYLSSKDVSVFKYQKEWLQTLKKYSILITESGEMERIRFLDKQRKYIEKLL